MALVVDHEPDPPARQHLADPIGVQRSDRRHHHRRLGRRPALALLDGDDPVFAHRGLDLRPGLLEQLGPVGQDQHGVLGSAGQLGEDHRLAGAGGQAHQLAADPTAPGLGDGL